MGFALLIAELVVCRFALDADSPLFQLTLLWGFNGETTGVALCQVRIAAVTSAASTPPPDRIGFGDHKALAKNV
jgi:hypothetical protein